MVDTGLVNPQCDSVLLLSDHSIVPRDFIDLDLKPLKKMEAYYNLDKKIASWYGRGRTRCREVYKYGSRRVFMLIAKPGKAIYQQLLRTFLSQPTSPLNFYSWILK